MDDGKAAGPKLKWWSRPGRPVTQPPTEAGPQAPVSSAGRTAGVPRASGAGDAADGADAAVASGASAVPEAPVVADAPERADAPEPAGVADRADAARTAEVTAVVAPVDGSATAADPAAAQGDVPDADADAAVRDRGVASTVTFGQAAAGVREETAAGHRDEVPGGGTATVTATAGPNGAPERPRPLHAEDPYGTPPYGGPGPWAPAPPVQRPMATPAQGTRLPPHAMPPQAPMPGASYQGPPPSPQPAAPGAPAPQPPGDPAPQPPTVPATPAAHPAMAPATPAAHPPTAPGTPAPPADPAHPAPAASAGDDGPSLQKPVAGPDATDTTAFVPHPGDGGPRPAGNRAAMPAGGGHGPAPTGAWQQYDPWSAPQHGGPAASPPVGAGKRGRRAPLVIGAVVAALLAGGVGGVIGAYIERYGGIDDIKLPQAAGDDGSRNPDSVAGIAQRALPGVVTLHVRGNAEQGTGTGFVLDNKGHILTNNHVVEPAGTGGEISVTFSGGQTAKAKVVGRDGGYDLAVVQVEGVTGLRPLPLGNSDAVRVGDPVVAIGAPYDLANTVTSGIISAKQRPITAGGQGGGSDVSYVDALQTDAPINPGNSGGPLVDAKARVIGINSAIRAADSGGGLDGGGQGGGQGGSIGLGFAIPINQARRVAEELINTGRATHPVIGVTLEMEYAGDGARVSARSKDGRAPVIPGGPGAKAGIRPGDVITKVDDAPVHSGEELIVKIRSHRPGDTLVLRLQRGGKEQTVRLTLGSSSSG
ncbi:trypsin-like peptidase domain-containing protein [Streptomyces sp. NPDC048483]|uniref:S1C family serine protease n=1 Tax=Streptomyces sp. NPDC048483 TaxID=3154927 RepID=UPI00342ADF7A